MVPSLDVGVKVISDLLDDFWILNHCFDRTNRRPGGGRAGSVPALPTEADCLAAEDKSDLITWE
jgi:hypothetical protein